MIIRKETVTVEGDTTTIVKTVEYPKYLDKKGTEALVDELKALVATLPGE